MLDQEPSHHIETLLVSCLSLATRPCILILQFCTMASPYNEGTKYLLHGGGVFNAMLSLWSPDVPNLVSFTYLGVPEDWGVPGHRMFPLWRILCLPRHFVAGGDVFMAANPGRSRSCPPRNFGDTDWQRFTLTTGTGFGHIRKCACYKSKSEELFPEDILVKHSKLVFVHIKADKNQETIGCCSL